MTKYKCSICKLTNTGYGNNADPINNGLCCDSCNKRYVIACRLMGKEKFLEYLKTIQEK